jgi:hypothetical protein
MPPWGGTEPHALLVYLRGQLVYETLAFTGSRWQAIRAGFKRFVVLDLSQVTLMGSAALGSLCGLLRGSGDPTPEHALWITASDDTEPLVKRAWPTERMLVVAAGGTPLLRCCVYYSRLICRRRFVGVYAETRGAGVLACVEL